MARFLHAEDVRHEIPPAVFGSLSRARPTPFILSDEQISSCIDPDDNRPLPAPQSARPRLCRAPGRA